MKMPGRKLDNISSKGGWITFFILLLHAAAALAGGGAATAELKLAAPAGGYQPGRGFTVGIDLVMPEGWHTYWINPGETGMAPDFKWTLPPGVALEAIRFPVPRRFDDGISVSLGYEGAVRLLADFKADQTAAAKIDIGLKALWMICKDLCLPVESQADITLHRSKRAEAVADDGFAAARERLPRAAANWQVALVRQDDALSVRIIPPPDANLSEEAWRQAWLFSLRRDAFSLAEPPGWQRDGDAWTARLKGGLSAPKAGEPFAVVLACPTSPVTGWLLEGMVGR